MNPRVAGFLDAQRTASSGVLVVFNIADFKRYNDALGHEMGDRAIADFEHALVELLAPPEAFLRVAGDEWLVVLHRHPLETASALIESFAAVSERRVGWFGTAERGDQIATAVEAVRSEVHRAMACVYGPLELVLARPDRLRDLSDACHCAHPGTPVALASAPPIQPRLWRAVREYPARAPYCPLCEGTAFEWHGGDGSTYGGEGRCRGCGAAVDFRNADGEG